jgi:hypothetical protein
VEFIYAGYGCYSATWNVTEKVKSRYQAGEHLIPATNEMAGGDPAPGYLKYLYVIWKANGGMYSAVCQERDILPLPTAVAAPAPAARR